MKQASLKDEWMDVEGCLKKKWVMNREEAVFDRDSGNSLRRCEHASYKCITYDPLGRETDGVCSRK